MTSPLSLRCGRCDKTFKLTPELVMMHSRPDEVHPGWHGVLILPAVVCPGCGAEDDFSLARGASFKLLGGLLRGMFGGAPGEARIASGEVKLWDGTVARSATHALAHLRSLTEQRPTEAEPWRRLGNFCLRCKRSDEAEKAFRQALDVDPDDVESRHSLIDLLIESSRVKEALPMLQRALAAVPVARWSPVEMRREIALDVLQYLAELMDGTGQGLSLEVVWRCDRPGSEPTLVWSRAELLAPWERLVEVLVSERTVQVQLGTLMPADRTSILRGILDGDDPIDEALGRYRPGQTVPSQVAGLRPRLDAHGLVPTPQDASESMSRSPLPAASTPAPISAAPRVGRNEPCPCGSGKKYKKCCGH